MTRSAEIVARVRQYVAIERSLYPEESPLQITALEMAERYEALIHRLMKDEAAGC